MYPKEPIKPFATEALFVNLNVAPSNSKFMSNIYTAAYLHTRSTVL